MIVHRWDYRAARRGHPGASVRLDIERPEDLSAPAWQGRFRDLAVGVFRQALWDLSHGHPVRRAQAQTFLTATPGSSDWPLFEHWWGYLGFSSITRFQARVRTLGESSGSLEPFFRQGHHLRSRRESRQKES